MTKQFYDDFGKLPIAKMAQLSKGFEEMVEAIVIASLVNTIFNTL